jgi:hypothetical protein
MTTSNSFDKAYAMARSAAARLRGWFDPPLDADARPLEIRSAILDRIEQRLEPTEAGRRVLPGNRILVSLLAGDRSARALLDATLTDLDATIQARLRELRCPLPHGFAVDIEYLKKPPADWAEGQRFSVDLARTAGGRPAGIVSTATTGKSKPSSSSPPVSSARNPALRVNVRRGIASEPEYVFSEMPVLIGRTAAPVDRAGRPRHNHVVFLDEGSEHNATVGRAHASIRFESAHGQFRLFDDGSHNGTRILRRGETIDITPHNPVGVALLSGDEIQFGTAAVVVTIDP